MSTDDDKFWADQKQKNTTLWKQRKKKKAEEAKVKRIQEEIETFRQEYELPPLFAQLLNLRDVGEDVANKLLDEGADPNDVYTGWFRDLHECNALHVVAKYGCSNALFDRILQKITDVNVQVRYDHKRTALHMVVASKHMYSEDYLPKDEEERHEKQLHFVTKLVGRENINLSLEDDYGKTPLHKAVVNCGSGDYDNAFEIVKALLPDDDSSKNKGWYEWTDKKGKTPMDLAYSVGVRVRDTRCFDYLRYLFMKATGRSWREDDPTSYPSLKW